MQNGPPVHPWSGRLWRLVLRQPSACPKNRRSDAATQERVRRRAGSRTFPQNWGEGLPVRRRARWFTPPCSRASRRRRAQRQSHGACSVPGPRGGFPRRVNISASRRAPRRWRRALGRPPPERQIQRRRDRLEGRHETHPQRRALPCDARSRAPALFPGMGAAGTAPAAAGRAANGASTRPAAKERREIGCVVIVTPPRSEA